MSLDVSVQTIEADEEELDAMLLRSSGTVDKMRVSCLIDTCCTRDLISPALAHKMNTKVTTHQNKMLNVSLGAEGARTQAPLQTIEGLVEIGDGSCYRTFTLHDLPKGTDVILSRRWMKDCRAVYDAGNDKVTYAVGTDEGLCVYTIEHERLTPMKRTPEYNAIITEVTRPKQDEPKDETNSVHCQKKKEVDSDALDIDYDEDTYRVGNTRRDKRQRLHNNAQAFIRNARSKRTKSRDRHQSEEAAFLMTRSEVSYVLKHQRSKHKGDKSGIIWVRVMPIETDVVGVEANEDNEPARSEESDRVDHSPRRPNITEACTYANASHGGTDADCLLTEPSVSTTPDQLERAKFEAAFEEIKGDLDPKTAQLLQEYKLRVFRDDCPPGLPPSRFDGQGDFKIEIYADKTVGKSPNLRLSHAEMMEARKQVRYLLDKGWIKPRYSPYAVPILFVKKKDGGLRMCSDFRRVNEATIPIQYQLPRLEELLGSIQGAEYLSLLDLRNGYWQVRMAEESKDYTCFKTPFGTYGWEVMTFGMKNAGPVFQENMRRIFEDEFMRPGCGVCIYIDDLCIYARNEEEHLEMLRVVLQKLEKYKFYCKLSKCSFKKREIDYMGYVVTGKTIRPDPKKVSEVAEWRTPRNVHDVRSFLGLCNYNRRFIRHYARMAAPITELTKLGRKFVWTQECDRAFKQLKETLTTYPLLRLYDPEKPCTVDTDASKVATGGVIFQEQEDGLLHPVCYESRIMTKSERAYNIRDRELLAIMTMLKKHKTMLRNGHPLTIVTDHQTLRGIRSQKIVNDRQARWLLDLVEYPEIQIVYRPGRKHLAADAMTRKYSDDDEDVRSQDYTDTMMEFFKNAKIVGRIASDKDLHVPLPGVDVDISLPKGSEEYEDCKVETVPVNFNVIDCTEAMPSSLDYIRCTMDTSLELLRDDLAMLHYLTTEEVTISDRIETWDRNGDSDEIHVDFNCTETTTTSPTTTTKKPKKDASIEDVDEWVAPLVVNMDKHKEMELGDAAEFVELLVELYPQCPEFSANYDLLSKKMNRRIDGFVVQDKILYLYDQDEFEKIARICVPRHNRLRTALLKLNHDHPEGGHLSWVKFYDKMWRRFYWKGMSRWCQEYVKTCDICQRMKESTLALPGLISPLPRPDRPFGWITMDLIVGLPPSSTSGSTSIIVFVCRLSKRVLMKALTPPATGKKIMEAYRELVYRHRGLADTITADRDSRFTSPFFAEVKRRWGTSMKLTTSYHPQGDGQSEIFIRTIKRVVRCYISYEQDDWEDKIVDVEMAINDSKSAATMLSPFMVDLGSRPRMTVDSMLPTCRDIPAASSYVENANLAQKIARDAIASNQNTMARTVNVHRRDIIFRKGDWLMLSTKDHMPESEKERKSDKLKPKWFGPFQVIKRLSDLTYELMLPKSMKRVHNVFHIEKLRYYYHNMAKFASRNAPPPPPDEVIDGDELYEVEKVLQWKKHGDQFLVKWVGYPSSDNQWLKRSDLKCDDLIEEFENKRKQQELLKTLKSGNQYQKQYRSKGPRKRRRDDSF